ncbi:hypothetical protein DERF_004983 [Dermatophagoides farinae]|uniref:Uncharacterized protein n=1 Tax=Dermatophagoides farinae TaxID=6954 RepID=A0A922I4T1_DERFA|nr:hypothetical protein DERF_004983 [Dermatophagoides farinae]
MTTETRCSTLTLQQYLQAKNEDKNNLNNGFGHHNHQHHIIIIIIIHNHIKIVTIQQPKNDPRPLHHHRHQPHH